MTEEINPKDCHFFIQARLECGSEVQLAQRTLTTPWELIIKPKKGTTLQDFARFHEGELRINMDEGSAIGMYQLFGLILNPARARKKFLGLF